MTVAIRVLIVDDTASMRELMRMHAIESGMEVVGEAADGVEAVSVALETQPDAVILDVEMPRMDGLQALPELSTAVPSAKVVVFSSRGEAATAPRAHAGGAAGVFYKGQHKSGEVVEYVQSLFPVPRD